MAKRDEVTPEDAPTVALMLEALKPEGRWVSWSMDDVARKVLHMVRTTGENWMWAGRDLRDMDKLMRVLVREGRVVRVVVNAGGNVRRAMYRLPDSPTFEVFPHGTNGEWAVRLGERTVCIVFQPDEANEIAQALNESRGNA